MALFPTEIESERLRYDRLHPDDFDPFELYGHVRSGAPDVDEITEYLAWGPYDHPKEAFDWVERCGANFESGDGATYVLRPTDGERAEELAGLAGLHSDWDRRLATMGMWLRTPFCYHGDEFRERPLPEAPSTSAGRRYLLPVEIPPHVLHQ